MVDQPHFDVSAAVVRQLGEELVSDEVTAIVELVKNAYDADATYANVAVNTKDFLPAATTKYPNARGFVTIEDDGFGMNEGEIKSGWLMISLSTKRQMKSNGGKTPKGRTPLGDKGLGRLSTQKLGENLEMVTRKDGSGGSSRVSFSWASFTDNRKLSDVPVSIETKTEPERAKGTLLAISGLRNPNVWEGSAADQLVTDLSQIISPFPEARPFLVTLKINGRPIDLGQVSQRVRSAAVGRFFFKFLEGQLTIDGEIRLAKLLGNDPDAFSALISRDHGRAFFDYLLKKPLPVSLHYPDDKVRFATFSYSVALSSLGDVDTIASANGDDRRVTADPGPFSGEIDEFLLRHDPTTVKLAGLTNANEVQKIVKRQAGIKVFRDGFGIRPYGINGQDWLRLGAGWTSAGSYYGLRPQNVLGFVLISEENNSNLKEKTDREGFVSNPWSQNFQRLVMQIPKTVSDLYETIRRTFNEYRREIADKARPLGPTEKTVADASSVAERLASYTERAISLSGGAVSARERIQKVTDRIHKTPILSSAAERELSDLLTEANAALESSTALFSEMEEYAVQARALADIVGSLAPRLDVMSDQLNDFTELAGLGLVAETLSHEVQNQTDRLMQQASGAIKKGQTARPQNRDLVQFGQEVTSTVSALRRLVGHLGPSLRYQRDKIEVIEISSLLKELKEHFKTRWEGDDFSCSLRLTGSNFDIETNRGRMLQVLDNLLLNSEYWLKETAKRDPNFRPEIVVEYEPYRLHVSDNGPGVEKSVEEALFEPFVTLKSKQQGRGLGLFINAQIMESIGGQITLLPDRNADGRRFIFEVDLASVGRG
ncbi:ATP-binding protein [Mesorhizobium sangaii]|uniref:histidine kinase n=1 Tax=Mesorhizobium sangaii TaxID=505389 RepID=A0A841PUJ5_9HYPH|nr:ATP-binding protein [Mesorhizobium sangaii]MBB6413712.1 signal transduction histidine kinase [Mesorhizobium sangaii]